MFVVRPRTKNQELDSPVGAHFVPLGGKPRCEKTWSHAGTSAQISRWRMTQTGNLCRAPQVDRLTAHPSARRTLLRRTFAGLITLAGRNRWHTTDYRPTQRARIDSRANPACLGRWVSGTMVVVIEIEKASLTTRTRRGTVPLVPDVPPSLRGRHRMSSEIGGTGSKAVLVAKPATGLPSF